MLFKTQFFRQDSCIVCKKHTSPTFRERFYRETTSFSSFEKIQELQQAYGKGFFELGLIQPKSMLQHAAVYILKNPKQYLLDSNQRMMVVPGAIQTMGYRGDIIELRLEHAVAINAPNADVNTLNTKLEEDIEEIVARFTARLTPLVAEILSPWD